MEKDLCDFCKVNTATSHCGGLCGTVMYCSQKCATAHFYDGHNKECPEAISKIIVEVRPKFEQRMFYKESVKKMKNLYTEDILAWFAFQIYLTGPFINTLMFAVKGNWSKFDNSFGRSVRDTPLAKFDFFFARMLTVWQVERRNARLGASTKKILTLQQLLMTYPQLDKYFKMSNSRFTYMFVTHMQKAILSMPPTKLPLTAWRGYTPLNIPGTLTMDLRTVRVGHKVTTWGFMSVAINKSIASNYVGSGSAFSPACCFLRVLIPKNTQFFMISGEKNDLNYEAYSIAIKEQTEIILPAGTILKITAIHPTNTIITRPPRPPVNTMWADAIVVGRARIKMKPIPK